jgi:hypothetical protein
MIRALRPRVLSQATLAASFLTSAAAAQSIHFQYTDPNYPGAGYSVCGLGDVSADGIPDVAVGTYREDCGFVGCGAAASHVVVLSGVDGTQLYEYVPGTLDGSGFALDLVGDVNADGRPDFVVGAPDFGGPAQSFGQITVHSGLDGSVLLTVPGPQPHADFGTSVAGVGDVDGDGVPDFAGAWWAEVRVYSGATGGLLHIFPSSASTAWTSTVERYGDYDSDGRADVLVGFTDAGQNVPGVVEIRSGMTGGVLKTFLAPGNDPTFGWSVDAAGDIDNDGKIDVIVGAPQIDYSVFPSGPGYVAVYSATGTLIRQTNGTQFGGHLGMVVAGGGNLDGDGVPDYAAAKACEPGSVGCSREVFVYSGASGAVVGTLNSAETGFNGISLEFVGDLDQDTGTELAFGSPCSDPWSQCGNLDVVSFGPGGPTAYCTAGTSTSGCVPSIGATGIASASASSGFTLTATGVEGQKQGILFYGVSGRVAVPWGAGGSSYLCVKAPTQRMNVQSSGGTLGQCDGQFATDWLAFIATHPGALGAPFQAGDVVQAQAWYRDPPAVKTTNLTDGIEFALVP